jgi:superfamily II DNA or RNA helicase
MNDSRYPELGLYAHNADSYTKIKSMIEDGQKVVGIVHATGTGKSFNALQLALDNKDKKIVYVVPSKGIIEHLREIINSNPNLDFDRDFPNLEFRTYQSFISLEEDEIRDIDCDLLILDEFHHIGAPVWGSRINTMIETHPDIQVFGMTAYTVRDRGTSYERDMADPDTDELFSGKIASRYDLADAITEGVLPKPIYKSAYVHLKESFEKLEEKILKLDPNSKNYKDLIRILPDIRKRIHEAPSISDVLKKQLKPNGKYIYFCPPFSEDGINDIETIKKRALEWFKQIYPGKEIVIYTSTSDMGAEGKKNRDAFYKDKTLDGEDASDKLRIMFAINQYNEGIHAPNIDGVILGRGTTSDIVYFEQLGRALSVRGNTKEKIEELEKLPFEDIVRMCRDKDIPIREGDEKIDLIEKLVSPIVIDLANNIEYIKGLENDIRDKIKLYSESGRDISRRVIRDASFDIEMINQEIFELLKYVSDRLIMTWEDYYELAKAYYLEHGNLFVSRNFRTFDGVELDENGVNLYNWILNQQRNYNDGTLSKERIDALEAIGMVWDYTDYNWKQNYELAKAYYNHYGNLKIPCRFRTKNGIDPCDEKDKDSILLGAWVSRQCNAYKDGDLTQEQIDALEAIGIVWKGLRGDNWNKKYELAKAYYEKYENLMIPQNFKTKDGVHKSDDKDAIELGLWISNQRVDYQKYIKNKGMSEKQRKIFEKRIELLEEIGMIWDSRELKWYKNYELAKAYYKEHGNLDIKREFKTKDGVHESDDEDVIELGLWISKQRVEYQIYINNKRMGEKQRKIFEKRIKLLEEIGMIWNTAKAAWYRNYELAKAYYNHYGNLNIPNRFRTKNGVDECNEEGSVTLGKWLGNQRLAYRKGELSKEQIDALEALGIDWNPEQHRFKKK